MVKKFSIFVPLIFVVGMVIYFFSPFFFYGKVPIPADTIVGLYHPYRDLYSNEYPNGIPYKNFLITDPVRQTYIWKELSINQLNSGSSPSWNPYEMAGKPLAANFQSAPYYPLNFLLLLKPFHFGWSLFIFVQPLLLGIFTYLYVRNLKLPAFSAIIASIAFVFSGFSTSWLEWGNILHTVLWLPLLLYSIDKEFEKVTTQKPLRTRLLFLVALCMSFLAGHLQVFLYTFLIAAAYFILTAWNSKKMFKKGLIYAGLFLLFLVATIIQWLPTMRFILASARSIDQNYLSTEGWFLPFRHLIQLIAPDFFGNPSTLNYWGTWNYGELTLYVGITPLLFVLFSFFKPNKHILFFSSIFLISMLLALPTLISNIPFVLGIPLISTAQPTRLIYPATFSLAILAAFGATYIANLSKLKPKHLIPISFILSITAILWVVTFIKPLSFFGSEINAEIAFRNLAFPTIFILLGSILVVLMAIVKNDKARFLISLLILLAVSFEMIRFAQKFTPFTTQSYLYPQTKTISFLKSQKGTFRIASLDRRILPPNFTTHYKLQTIEGYDPLYLESYARFITTLENNNDVDKIKNFNRIITVDKYDSQLFDFLNVRYILSLNNIDSPKLRKIFEEGQTKVYENNNSFDRAYFVENVVSGGNLNEIDISRSALVEGKEYSKSRKFSTGTVTIVFYSEDRVDISTINEGEGFLVMSDTNYPTWKAFLDGKETKIYNANIAFRGVVIPPGKHMLSFQNSKLGL